MSVIDIDVTDLATRASEALAAEVALSGWALVRERLAGFLRRRGESDDVQRQLAELDSAAGQVGTGREGAQEALRDRCFWQLGAYLSSHRDIATELEELIAAWGPGEGGSAGMSANGNKGSVIIQAGGNVSTGTGSITASGRPGQ
ncbi:hypothetical protein ACFYST_23685 [Kitasatospora sp. NPDC004614]|uniref:hypothetical protein n=1 Tax=unclassified Kitasatospora TaxID=2633591 RepID=UPI00368E37AC